MIETNKKYYTKGEHYFIIREDRYNYYIMDSSCLEFFSENPIKHEAILSPVFECSKSYDSDWQLENFLEENGAIK